MRTTLLLLAVALLGCDRRTSTVGGGGPTPNVIEPDTRPAFILDASKPFVIEFGRGSGSSGLDVVKVKDTGAVKLYRIASAGGQNIESASLRLPRADVAKLVSLVNAQQLTSMPRAYSANIADGTQWVLWIEQSSSEKSVYFNNSFPPQITTFATGLDALLAGAGSNALTWTQLPKQQGLDEQAALWAHIQ
jgi:hypothetical protein